MKFLLSSLFALLLLSACSYFSRKTKETPVQPAADPAIAAATSFSTNLTEVFLDQRGIIASGTIRTNAPLVAATDGTYSLAPRPDAAVSYPGKTVASRLVTNPAGKIRIRHSGNQAVLDLLAADGRALLTIIGPPNGNAIRSSWFHEGTDSGLVTLEPQRGSP